MRSLPEIVRAQAPGAPGWAGASRILIVPGQPLAVLQRISAHAPFNEPVIYGLIAPVGNVRGLRPAPTATSCTGNYPCFYPAGYAIDTVIPIISVHQASYWGPNGSAPWGWS